MSCPSTTYVTVRGTYCREPSFAGQRCVLSTMSASALWGANTRSGLQATRAAVARCGERVRLALESGPTAQSITSSVPKTDLHGTLSTPQLAVVHLVQASDVSPNKSRLSTKTRAVSVNSSVPDRSSLPRNQCRCRHVRAVTKPTGGRVRRRGPVRVHPASAHRRGARSPSATPRSREG